METLTHEQVDELEDKLRKAQNILEEAAQMVSGVPGDYGPHIWSHLTYLADAVGDTFRDLYRLRPM